MIGFAMHTTIITLWKQNKSKRAIARITGHDRKTVTRIIRLYEEEGKEEPVMQVKPHQLTAYHDKIIKYVEEGLTAVRVHEKLVEQGENASYSTVQRYIAGIKLDDKICIRFHSSPGEEAQVDFGYVGKLPDVNGRIAKCYIFNMRLSYSRLDYYEAVHDQKVETFIRCHINAFQYFGGCVKVVKVDNLKAAILEAHFYEPTYQELYKKFADYYRFFPLPCRVAQPQEKGKTEAGIKYVKINFFAGRTFNNYNELVNGLRDWLNNKCNMRVHGTTKRVPRELFEVEERSKLIPLPTSDFIFSNIMTRKVGRDCHITMASNYYSVPYKYVDKVVEITLDTKLIKISYQGSQIAVHERYEGKGKFITNKSHYPPYKLYEPHSEEYRGKYYRKLKNLGERVGEVFLMMVKYYPHSWHNMAKGIINLQRHYPKQVINMACERAMNFNAVSYSKIRDICKSGSYILPTENYKEE